MSSLRTLFVPIILGLVNSSYSQLVHGSTYRIKNVADANYITASPHNFIPNGVNPGKVFVDAWREHSNQLWDAIAVQKGSESLEGGYWLLPKTAALNDLSAVGAVGGISKNLVNLRPLDTSKTTYLIRSATLDKCFQSHRYNAATYEKCDASNPQQQWEFEALYNDD